jgi:hypothetical protein
MYQVIGVSMPEHFWVREKCSHFYEALSWKMSWVYFDLFIFSFVWVLLRMLHFLQAECKRCFFIVSNCFL